MSARVNEWLKKMSEIADATGDWLHLPATRTTRNDGKEGTGGVGKDGENGESRDCVGDRRRGGHFYIVRELAATLLQAVTSC